MDPWLERADRPRRTLLVLATVAAVLAVVLGVARLVPLHDTEHSGSRLPPLPLPSVLPTITLPSLPGLPSLPTLSPSPPSLEPPRPPRSSAAVPSEIVAFTPGGAERPTVVRTSTGKTVRVLGPGTQWVAEQGSDHAHIYLPYEVTSPCERGWKAVTVASGATRTLPGLQGLTAFAERPAGGQVATVVARDGCGNAGTEVDNVLEVREIATGKAARQVTLPVGNWFVEAWSPDGGELLLADKTTNTTWAVYDAATLEVLRTLPTPADNCEGGDATLRGDGDVIRAETCTDAGATHVDLVDLGADGQELRRTTVVRGPQGSWDYVRNGLGLDASGQNVVLCLSPMYGHGEDGQLWYVAGTRPHRVGLSGVFGAFW